jgi:hypothetical protein
LDFDIFSVNFVYMNRGMQQKIAAFKKMAAPVTSNIVANTERVDSLSEVVRSKKEAEDFMADIEGVITRARQKSR